jgi:hypothetical protein
MLLLFSGSGLHSIVNASATGVPTPFLMALLTSAYGSSCPSPHLNIICMISGIFFKLEELEALIGFLLGRFWRGTGTRRATARFLGMNKNC